MIKSKDNINFQYVLEMNKAILIQIISKGNYSITQISESTECNGIISNLLGLRINIDPYKIITGETGKLVNEITCDNTYGEIKRITENSTITSTNKNVIIDAVNTTQIFNDTPTKRKCISITQSLAEGNNIVKYLTNGNFIKGCPSEFGFSIDGDYTIVTLGRKIKGNPYVTSVKFTACMRDTIPVWIVTTKTEKYAL
jgi:hypothetical protein